MIKHKYLTLDNQETISYLDFGDSNSKNILVCIHGNFGSCLQFHNFFDNIPNDIRIILPDLRGFGQSTYNTHINSFNEHAEDIINLLDKLNVSNFSLLGFYIGGAVAMEMASKLKTRVKKLILISSVGTMGYPMVKLNTQGEVIPNEYLTTRDEIENDIFRVMPLKQVIKNKDRDFVEGIIESAYFLENPTDSSLKEMLINDVFNQKNITDTYVCLNNFNISNKNNGVIDGNNKISEITAETIVIQGSNDPLVPLDMIYTIKYSLLSKSRIITGPFGHSPFNDVPKWINDTVFEFLQS